MDCNNTFETPIANFRRLIEQDSSDKFQIILSFSSSEKYFQEVSRNEVRVISKKINDLCMIDPTLDQYEITIPVNQQKQEVKDIQNNLQLLIRSTRGQVTIPNDKQKQFHMIRFLLGDESSENFYEISSIEEGLSLLNTEFELIGINYLSDHLLEFIESGGTKHVSEEKINSIFNKYNSEERTEEEKKRIICKLKEEKEEEIAILFILGMKISETESDDFLKETIEFLLEHLDDDILRSDFYRVKEFIRELFGLKLKMRNLKEKLKSKEEVREVKFRGDELSGIISELKLIDGENFEGSGSLKLTGGGYPNPSNPLTNLIQYDQSKINNSYYNFFSQNPSSESDSWIEFDFVNRRINLTSYTIRSDCNSRNCYTKPKSWRIVGSNDHDKWTVLDHKENNSDLNGRNKQHRFECSNTDGYYRYIRYIQEDSWNSSSYKYNIQLTSIEMFGSIMSQID